MTVGVVGLSMVFRLPQTFKTYCLGWAEWQHRHCGGLSDSTGIAVGSVAVQALQWAAWQHRHCSGLSGSTDMHCFGLSGSTGIAVG